MYRSSQLASSRSRSRDSAAKVSLRSNPRAASKCSIRVHVSEREGTSVRASLRAGDLRARHTVPLRKVQPGAFRSRAPGQHARSRGSPARAFSRRASRSSKPIRSSRFSASECDHTFFISMCSPFRRNEERGFDPAATLARDRSDISICQPILLRLARSQAIRARGGRGSAAQRAQSLRRRPVGAAHCHRAHILHTARSWPRMLLALWLAADARCSTRPEIRSEG